MDFITINRLLTASLYPNQLKQSEEQLSQISKLLGFAPLLLQVVTSDEVDLQTRRAGAIYFKHFITLNWVVIAQEDNDTLHEIHQQDRNMIRDMIFKAIIQSPGCIRDQLCCCFKHIVIYDFPKPWSHIIQQIYVSLQKQEQNPKILQGVFICLYQIIKKYEYKFGVNREPIIGDIMRLFLPLMIEIIKNLQECSSAESAVIQKQILKIFEKLVKYELRLDVIHDEMFIQWMGVLRLVIEQPVPEQSLVMDEMERPTLPWWKSKKWAIKILYRFFERYCSPVHVAVEFAEWYLKQFAADILMVLLNILDQYKKKIYVSPKVLAITVSYITQCVHNSYSWMLLKPNILAIIGNLVLPMLSFSKSDENLLNSDCQQCINFDVYQDSVMYEAQNLIMICCEKEQGMLEYIFQLCLNVINNQYLSRQKDGALHMIGMLLKKFTKTNGYESNIDMLLSEYIFPQFNSPYGYVRARASWIIRLYSCINIKNKVVLMEAVHLNVNTLLNDPALMAKTEAADALQMILLSCFYAKNYLEPHLERIVFALLQVALNTENDNIIIILQNFLILYSIQLRPIIHEVTKQLIEIFVSKLNSNVSSITILKVIHKVIMTTRDSPELSRQLENPVLELVRNLFEQRKSEYYEIVLSLLCDLNTKSVSAAMWRVFEWLLPMFYKIDPTYFEAAMPTLYNYITVDTNAFVSNENRVLSIINIAKSFLSCGKKGIIMMCSVKLLEVMVIQCIGKIDNCLPSIVDFAMNALAQLCFNPFKKMLCQLNAMKKNAIISTFLMDSTLFRRISSAFLISSALYAMVTYRRQVCDVIGAELHVLLAALYYNPYIFFNTLSSISHTNLKIVLDMCLHVTDHSMDIHFGKLYVLGVCRALEIYTLRSKLGNLVLKLLVSCLMVFDESEFTHEDQTDTDEELNSFSYMDCDEHAKISTDEDIVIDDAHYETYETTTDLFNMVMSKKIQENEYTSDLVTECIENHDNKNSFDLMWQATYMDSYTTLLDNSDCQVDECIEFMSILMSISSSEPGLFNSFISLLSYEQRRLLKHIYLVANERSRTGGQQRHRLK